MKLKICLALSGTLAVVGCGSGLPGCNSQAAQAMTKNVIMKNQSFREGDACVIHTKFGVDMEELGHKPCDTEYLDWQGGQGTVTTVHDATFYLIDYLVESEERASDGRSMTCSISTKYRVGSQQANLDLTGGPQRLTLRYYGITDSGERRYEYELK